MPYIGKQPTVGNFQVCDAISVVNGQAAYTMQVASTNVTPETAFHMLVSLNGVLQKPGSSFTISGSTITFASNLATGDVIDFIILLGDVLNIGTPSDDTITAAKLNDTMISGLTALTSAPEDTDEFIISDGGTLKRIDASLVGGGNTPYFEAHSASDQDVSDEAITKVTLGTEIVDSDSKFASSRFTPTVAGKYYIEGQARVGGSSGQGSVAQVTVYLYKNGSAYKDAFVHNENASSASLGNQTLGVSAIIDMDTDDYVELYARSDTQSGTPRFIDGTKSTYLLGFKIG